MRRTSFSRAAHTSTASTLAASTLILSMAALAWAQEASPGGGGAPPAPPPAEDAQDPAQAAAPEVAPDGAPEVEEAPLAPPSPGFLGVSMAPWPVPDSDPAAALVEVTAVVADSAAERAGLEAGDVIAAVDGEPTASPPDQVLVRFGAAIRGRAAGEALSLTIRRRAVAVSTYLDEEPLGPPADATGAEAAREVLPDLDRLLSAHPDRLVGVRARAYTQEREVRVVLGSRPGSRAAPLPPNAELRPTLEAQPLQPAAALAERLIDRAQAEAGPVADRYRELLARFEADEGLEDPFRLKTVRYLHRAPLRLANATHGLGRELLGAVHPERSARRGRRPGLPTLLSAAEGHLEGVAPPTSSTTSSTPTTTPDPRAALPQLPFAPRPGAAPRAHGDYALALVGRAEERLERALGGLSAEERAFLAETLPGLAAKFAEHIYLHEDDDRERWARHARAIQLMARVDRAALLDALRALSPLADPQYLVQLRADLSAAEDEGRDLIGHGGTRAPLFATSDLTRVLIGGSGNNEYRQDAAVVIDLGGDDRYHTAAGGAGPGQARVLIDLGGNDRYQSTVAFAQGSALLGAALLVDGGGHDRYTSSQPFAQGAALCGAAALIDLAGDDVFRGTSYAQGAAIVGLGALIDAGGEDRHAVDLYGQGFAGPGAFGALLTQGGDDHYVALGRSPCSYGDAGTFRGMSQGAAVGFRQHASGGVAVLLDEGGRDEYEAGNFSQGGGYYFGWGALIDHGGEADRYEGSRYAQGFAAHSALGSLWDDGGDDVYRSWVGAAGSASWDLTVTVFLDDDGDDVYETGPGFSAGASAHNGFSLFCDRRGRDTYRVAPGAAGPNDYHGGPSVSVFLDAGGDPDTYRGGGLADGRAGVQGHVGVLVDLDRPLDSVDDGWLEALFPAR